MNAALLSSVGAGLGTAFTAANAFAQKFGGTNQAASASSQFSLDKAISGLSSAVKSNNLASHQAAADANAFTAAQADKAMQFSAAEAAKNRDWQKMMSDTAHQREVADLQAAGLNPVLSAMGGNGASVGSGATASSSAGSGQQADTDKSLSSGLVSLLGNLLQTQTQLASTAMSARSNEAIADKNNSMSQLVAELTGQYSLARQSLADTAAMDRARLSADTSRYAAGLSAAASKYASDNSFAASKYATDIGASNAAEERATSVWRALISNPAATLTGILAGSGDTPALADFVHRASNSSGSSSSSSSSSSRGKFTAGGSFGGSRK